MQYKFHLYNVGKDEESIATIAALCGSKCAQRSLRNGLDFHESMFSAALTAQAFSNDYNSHLQH